MHNWGIEMLVTINEHFFLIPHLAITPVFQVSNDKQTAMRRNRYGVLFSELTQHVFTPTTSFKTTAAT